VRFHEFAEVGLGDQFANIRVRASVRVIVVVMVFFVRVGMFVRVLMMVMAVRFWPVFVMLFRVVVPAAFAMLVMMAVFLMFVRMRFVAVMMLVPAFRFVLIVRVRRAFVDAEFHALDRLPLLPLEVHVKIADLHFRQLPFKYGRRHAEIAKRADGHVTADSRETIEIKDAHKILEVSSMARAMHEFFARARF
jgi:hypothetical protein